MSDQDGRAPRDEYADFAGHADFAGNGRQGHELRLAGRPGSHSVDVISGGVHAL